MEFSSSLVELHQKYGQQVSFVSLTKAPPETDPATQKPRVFFPYPWPQGYATSENFLQRLGTTRDIGNNSHVGGFSTTSTVYVIGMDGRVAWCDQRARTHHVPPDWLRDDLDEVLRQLLDPEFLAAMQKATASPNTSPRPQVKLDPKRFSKRKQFLDARQVP